MRRLLNIGSAPLLAGSAIIFYDWIIFELAKAGAVFRFEDATAFHPVQRVTATGVWVLAILPSVMGLGIGLIAWRSRVLDFVGFLALLPIVALMVGIAFFVFGLFGSLCSLHSILACMSAAY